MKRNQVSIKLALFAVTSVVLICVCSCASEREDRRENSLKWTVRSSARTLQDESNVNSETSVQSVHNRDEDAENHPSHSPSNEMKYFYPSVPRSQLRKLITSGDKSRDIDALSNVISSESSQRVKSSERHSSQSTSIKDNERETDVDSSTSQRQEPPHDLQKESSARGTVYWSSSKEQLIDQWIKRKEKEEQDNLQSEQHAEKEQQKQSKLITSLRITSKKGPFDDFARDERTSNISDQQLHLHQSNKANNHVQSHLSNSNRDLDSPRPRAPNLHRFTNWTEFAIDTLQNIPMGDISSPAGGRKQETGDTSARHSPPLKLTDTRKTSFSWKPMKKDPNKLQRLDEEASASQYIASPPGLNNLLATQPQQQQPVQQPIAVQSTIPVHFPPVLLPPSSIQLQSAQTFGQVQTPSFVQSPVAVAPSLPTLPPLPPPSPPPAAPVVLSNTVQSPPVIQSPTIVPLSPPFSAVSHQQPAVSVDILKPLPQSAPVQVNFIRQSSPPVNSVAVNEPRVDLVTVQRPTSIAVHAPSHIIQRAPVLHSHLHSPPPTIIHSPVHHVHHSPPPPPATTVVHHPPAVVHTPPAVIHHPPEIVQRAPTVVHTPPALVPRAPTVFHSPRVVPIAAPLPIAHAPPIHHHHPIGIAHSPACTSRVPLLAPSLPVFAPTPFAAPVHLHHAPIFPVTRAATVVVPASPARTRTVLTQVQYIPEQTHVVTTTQYNPARKTTIYETDHVAAYSSNRPVIALPPRSPGNVLPVADAVQSPPREHATIYTFPSLVKNRIVGAPIRLTDRIIARRKTRQKERLQKYEDRQKVKKDKKIIFIDRQDSHKLVNVTQASGKVASGPFN